MQLPGDKPKRHRSMGDLISTATFAGLALWWALGALTLGEAGETWRAVGLWLCSAASLAAAARFAIHNFVLRLRRLRK